MGEWNENTFIMCRSYVEAIAHLDLEDRCRMFEVIADYGLNGCVPNDLNAVCTAMFSLIKPLMDSTQSKREKRRNTGAGAPKGNQNARKVQSKTIKNNQKQSKDNQKQTYNSKIDNSNIDDSKIESGAPAGTFANLVTIYTSDAHQLWHENLKRTYSLTDVELEECIRDGINYCINNGKALTESNIKRYTTIACRMVEHLAPMEQRDAEFKAECIALKDGSNDELVTEFYYYYRQPAKKDGNKMLFEMQVGWDTRTMFNLYLKRNGKY